MTRASSWFRYQWALLAVVALLSAGVKADETVTIEAQRQRELIEKQVDTYVSSIVTRTGDEALLRWHQPVCPAVLGLSSAEDDFVLTRLSKAVVDAGAPLAPEECSPNFLVLVTQHAQELLQKWWERNPTLFNDDHGVGGIKRFMSSKTPIRAWYNAELGCTQGAFRVRGGKTYIPSHCATQLSGSKLVHNVVRAITSVIIIVDIQQGTELTIGQITDYATFIGLAQIRESAEPGPAPTILHLFANNGEPRPEGLSTWDEGFLKALYNSDVDATTQVAEIKVRLDKDLTH